MSEKKFPEGFLWGEKWDGTHFARPCQLLCEYLEQSGDKVYSICKIQRFNI